MLGLVIGSNNFAAALTLGALGQQERRGRIVAVFGTVEFLIPLAGIWLGGQASAGLASRAEWIGPVLLSMLGLWALWSAVRKQGSDEALVERVTTWQGLILLALGLSVDNLLIGFSLGLAGSEPLLVAGTIAVFSITFTWSGLSLGSSARRHWERYAKIGAGVLLLGLAAASWLGWL